MLKTQCGVNFANKMCLVLSPPARDATGAPDVVRVLTLRHMVIALTCR